MNELLTSPEERQYCDACGCDFREKERVNSFYGFAFCQECAREYQEDLREQRKEFWKGLPRRAPKWLLEKLFDGFGMLLVLVVSILLFAPVVLALWLLAEVVRWFLGLLGS